MDGRSRNNVVHEQLLLHPSNHPSTHPPIPGVKGRSGLRIPEPVSSLTAQPFRQVTVPRSPAAAGETGCQLLRCPSGPRLRSPVAPVALCEGHARFRVRGVRRGHSPKEPTCLCGLRTGHTHAYSSALLPSRRAQSARGEGGVFAACQSASPNSRAGALPLQNTGRSVPRRHAAAGGTRPTGMPPPSTASALTAAGPLPHRPRRPWATQAGPRDRWGPLHYLCRGQ